MKLIFKEDFILALILVNVGVLYLHTFDELQNYFLLFEFIDITFTLFFTAEIIFKIKEQKGKNKVKKFLEDHWNKIDFFSVILSLPSIVAIFFNSLEIFTLFVVLRSLRVFKFLRIIEYIPNGKRISSQMFRAFKSVSFIVFAFTVYSTIISIISVSIFKHYSPTHFNNAFDSFFTIFRVFSGDGYSDVVSDIEKNSGKGLGFAYFTKLYFVFIVFTGSILGLSLINSIFVDEMSHSSKAGSKENKREFEELKEEIAQLRELNHEIIQKLKKLEKR